MLQDQFSVINLRETENHKRCGLIMYEFSLGNSVCCKTKVPKGGSRQLQGFREVLSDVSINRNISVERYLLLPYYNKEARFEKDTAHLFFFIRRKREKLLRAMKFPSWQLLV